MKMHATTLRARLATFVGAALGLVLSASADEPLFALNTTEDSSAAAYGTASRWTDYAAATPTNALYAPFVAGAAGVSYVITNAYVMRTYNNVSYSTCYGHLTVGSTDSSGTIRNKRYNAVVEYRGGLTVVKGLYESTTGGGSGAASYATVAGSVEVQSPAYAPFVFGGDIQYGGVYLDATLTGEEGTGLLIGSASQQFSFSELSGENSAYLGSFNFSTSGSISNEIASATALGGAPSTLVTDAVKITTKNRGTLRFTPEVGTCRIPATRGFYFDGISGGTVKMRTLQFAVDANADVEILGPIHANGTCDSSTKALTISKIGAGTLTLSGAFTRDPDLTDDKFTLDVAEGHLILASETAIALTKVASEKVWLKSPGTSSCALEGYTLGEGSRLIVRHADGAAGTFVLDETSQIAATPIAIQLVTDEEGYEAYEACVLKVPTSVRQLTAADFTDVDVDSAYDYPNTTFRIDVADGIQSVYLCRAANATIAHLTFESDFTSHVRKGTLSDAPTVEVAGPALSDDVAGRALTTYGNSALRLRRNRKSLSVGNGKLFYSDVGELFGATAQTIEFFVKADPQNQYQGVLSLLNGHASNYTTWSFIFDGTSAQAHDKMKVSFCKIASEDASPSNSSAPLAAQLVGDGKWHHVAYTFQRNAADDWKTDVAMYVDHQLKVSGTMSGRVNLDEPDGGSFRLAWDVRTANRFDGFLDEIRISRGVLPVEKFLKLRNFGCMVFVR